MVGAAARAGGGFGSYIQATQRFPLLTEPEERALARRLRAGVDAAAMQELVGSHLRLVTKIARGFAGYGFSLADLVAAGNLGLMRAVKGFDPDRGVRLSTYATWWIRAEIQEFVLQSWSLVHIARSPAQRRLFFHLRRLKARLDIADKAELTPEKAAEIGRVLHVSEEDAHGMNRRLSGGDCSLDAPIPGAEGANWEDRLVAEEPSQEEALAEREELSQRRGLLERGLSVLSGRERSIIFARRLSEEPMTLEALARRFGVTRERVRQIEMRALEKLRQRVGGEIVARPSAP